MNTVKKLCIKKDDILYECLAYDTPEEATPADGSYWPVKIKGTLCYLPLWPKDLEGGSHAPLIIKRDGIEYWLDTQAADEEEHSILWHYAELNWGDEWHTRTGPSEEEWYWDWDGDGDLKGPLAYIAPVGSAERAFADAYNMIMLSASGGEDETLNTWDMSGVTSMKAMFQNCYKCWNMHCDEWDVSNVTDMSYMFDSCYYLIDPVSADWNTSKVKDMSYMFSNFGCYRAGENQLERFGLYITNWDVSNVKNMQGMFSGCVHFPSLDFSNWNTRSVTDMSYMFANYGCASTDWSNPPTLNVSNFNTSNVTNMEYMFRDIEYINIPNLANWDVSNVKNMSNMFSCVYTETISGIENWNVSNVIDMSDMFNETNFTDIPVRNWNVSNVTNMSNIFRDCTNLTSLDLSGWNTVKAQCYGYMFYGCSNLEVLDLSGFDTTAMNTNSSYSGYMFTNCNKLKYIIIDNPTFKFKKLPSDHGLNNTCKILVPSNLLSTFTASSSGWYAKRSQFEAVENYIITRANGEITVTPNTIL